MSLLLIIVRLLYHNTLGPAYNEFGYNKHSAAADVLAIKPLIAMFGYNELYNKQLFFCIFMHVMFRL